MNASENLERMNDSMVRPSKQQAAGWIQIPLNAGILLSFLILPVWYRLPAPLPLLAPYYVSHFVLLAPLLWSISWWLVAGLPGFRSLVADRRRFWGLALLTLAGWALLSTRWAFMHATAPEVAATSALQFAIVTLFALVVTCAGPSSRQIATALIVGLVWNSILTILQVNAQHHLGLQVLGEFPMTPDHPGASILLAGELRWLRPYGLLPHPNLLGGFLVVGLFAAIPLLFSTQRHSRIIGCSALALGTWALLLTFSRGAWLGLAAGGLVVLLYLLPTLYRNRQTRRWVLGTGLVLIVIALVFAAMYWPFLAARAGIGQERVELRSIADRIVFVQLAERAIREAPLLGVGAGNFPWRSAYYLAETDFDLRGDNVHNIYLLAWAELGLVGVGLLAAAMLGGIVAFWSTMRKGPIAAIQVAFMGAFVALAITGLVDHYPWTLLHFQTAWWGCLAVALRPLHAGQGRGHSL